MRLKSLDWYDNNKTVSIHASVKDATKSYTGADHPNGVSIHASVKDATHWEILRKYIGSFNPRICKRCDSTGVSCAGFPACFNPRICKRCDANWCGGSGVSGVSIHASVKDATGRYAGRFLQLLCFNPRICKRCDSYIFFKIFLA